MVRTFVLAAALGAAGLAAAPAAASAGGLSIGVDVAPVGYYGDGRYGGGYAVIEHRGYRHGWDDRPRWRDDRPRFGYGFYRPRPYYGYRERPRCRIETVRSWNGYRYVVREREICGRGYRY